MRYQRLHIRVPATGKVFLSNPEGIKVQASIINVSTGGLCISAPSHLIDENEYQIQIITPSHGKILFSGLPVYQSTECIGIKITFIERDHLKKINQIVENFQITEDFIKHIDEKDIIDDWFVDETGEDITITFETAQDVVNG